MALPEETTVQPIASRRAGAVIGRLEQLLMPFAGGSTAAPATLNVAGDTRCSSARTFSISPGGVYELRLLIYLDGPEDHRIHPIEGQLTFRDPRGERVSAQFDVHAYRAGDLSRFVVEGFGVALARCDIDDLLVAQRYFVAPPYARQVTIELAAPMPFHIAWLECEPLVANWVREAEQVRGYLRKHHRLRLATLPSILADNAGSWTRADSGELARIAATELEQISRVTSLWCFDFDWNAALANRRIESLAYEYYRVTARDQQQRPAIAFIGGERLYNKLLAHFDVVLVPERASEELLGALSVKALVIESVAEDLNRGWSQVWCGSAEGAVAPAGQRLLEAAGRLCLPVVFYYTAARDDSHLFREMFELADHVFVEGAPDYYADARLFGADARTQFTPRSFERLLARPSCHGNSDGYAILLPVRSELLGSCELRCALAALPPKATLVAQSADELGAGVDMPASLRRCSFHRTASYHELLYLCRRAAITVLIGESCDRSHQQDMALDAIASGAVVVFMGDPDGLDGISRYVVRVGDPTQLSEQIRLLANHDYRRRVWLSSYREICCEHNFASVADRLKAVCHEHKSPVASDLRSDTGVVLAPAGGVQYG